MEKPILFNSKSEAFSKIKGDLSQDKIIDTYKEQLEDLFLVRHPQYKFNKNYHGHLTKFIVKHSKKQSLDNCGKWVYFPWNKFLVHYLDDLEHQEIRTARNKNVITKSEQEKFYNFKVGVAGLSVGSHGAITAALMGGCRNLKLADPDVVSPSNLNRMRFDFMQIGVNKTELVARYIYQLNPYADIHAYTDGITENNLSEFLNGLDILIEELDDIEVKIKIREEAKKRKIPVVMVTDNGDGVIVDIERFDINPNSPVFFGALEGFDIAEVKRSPQKMFEAMGKIIDVSLIPTRVLNSVLEVGKTIYSWPQLATAATLSGAVIAYVIKNIAIGESIKKGKIEINLDAILNPNYEKNKSLREKQLREFKKVIEFDENYGT